MMEFFRKIFRRKHFKPQPRQLRIDGIKTPLTPSPDDAELAAQALLETMAAPADSDSRLNDKPIKQLNGKKESTPHDAAYYRSLSDKIRAAHEAERRAAMRYVAYVEQQLSTPLPQGEGQGAGLLERGLYQHQDTVEREGGELKSRWQKCLALVIMKQFETKTNTDLTNGADEHQPSGI